MVLGWRFVKYTNAGVCSSVWLKFMSYLIFEHSEGSQTFRSENPSNIYIDICIYKNMPY